MWRYSLLVLLLITLLVKLEICSASHVIKIAILDNFKYQKFVTTRYKDYYLNGVAVAKKEAEEKGIVIVYKIFQYNQKDLSVLDQIPNVLEWKPDVIIGPRDSNKFLMLSGYFKNTLTISPFATSLGLEKMPDNYFSITMNDKVEADAISSFIQWKFPEKIPVILAEVDCKSCFDVTNALIENFSMKGNKNVYVENFVSGQGYSINLNDIDNKKSIIILPDNAHDTAVIMARLSNMQGGDVIFIGGDGWGSWEDTEVGKLGNLKGYTAYHVTPWGLEQSSKNIKHFKKRYFDLFKMEPKNKLSLIVNQAILSVIDSYLIYGGRYVGTTKEKILYSYHYALNKNKFWYKSTNYMVYRINSGKNTPYAKINMLKYTHSGNECEVI